MKKVLLILFLCAFWCTYSQAEVRTWHSAKSSVEGEFVELTEEGTIVRIRKTNGKIVRIPLDKLVREDQEYVKIRRDGGSPSAAGPAAEVAEESTLKAGTRKVFTVDGIEYAFRWCPPGEFMMGSTNGDDEEKPVHKVRLTQGFWLLETEVTQSMWESVMGESIETKAKQGTYIQDLCGTGSNYPMYYVNWADCQEFCQKLSEKLGQQVTLPSEAQWEYACRADTTGDYAGELDEMGWHRGNSDLINHEVGLKKPNAWGLYDMHGNVLEWCSDWYGEDYYSASPTSDPTGPNNGSYRVLRGGSWFNYAEYCCSAIRNGDTPTYRVINFGFRAALVPVSGD